MLDGHETVGNSLGKASLGGSVAGRKRYSMLDGHESVQIACGELRWEGAIPRERFIGKNQ